jgi:hypothetical protein
MRRWFYLISGVLAALIPVLIQVGLIDTGQGESTSTLIASIAAILGGGSALTAAHHTNQQVKAGIHDPALSPIDQIQEATAKVLSEANAANANVDKLRQMTGDILTAATADVPIVGPVVQQANNLAQQALDQLLPR